MIAAGPLDPFVCEREGCLKWIEHQAAQSDAFRQAIALQPWVFGELADEAALRIERAAGQQLRRPRVWTGP